MGEIRVYYLDYVVFFYIVGLWEEIVENGDVRFYFESLWICYNFFFVFGLLIDKLFGDFQVDYVRWEIDFIKLINICVVDFVVILDMFGEMVRVDECFLIKLYDKFFCFVIFLGKQRFIFLILFIGLYVYVMFDKFSGKVDMFDFGQGCIVEELIFVFRIKDVLEGDGWVLGMIQRMDVNRSDLVVLDIRDFGNLVVVVQLFFRIKGQIYGNWVDVLLGEKSMIRILELVEKIMGKGVLQNQ